MLKLTQVEIAGKGQNVDYSEVGTYEGRKIKLHIHVDSYKNQGYARAFVWSADALKWNEIYSILPLNMKTDKDLGYGPKSISRADFATDRNTLLDYVKQVL